jgi:cyclic di-GMP phosphodiesterase
VATKEIGTVQRTIETAPGETLDLTLSSNLETGDASILMVEDDPGDRRLLRRILEQEGHNLIDAEHAGEAKRLLKSSPVDMVLIDINLPDRSGLSLLAEITSTYPDTACIMVTGEDRRELGEAALTHGAYGYIIKPFSSNELLINVSSGLRRQKLEKAHRLNEERLEHAVDTRTRDLWETNLQLAQREDQLRLANRETIERLALAAEFRDDDTARHVTRVSEYCGLLAQLLGSDREDTTQIRLASVLHDVGKIGVPDQILRKPGKLTEDERSIIETHPEMGHRILAGSQSELLRQAALIALTHHERWDGTGYPNGLSGTEIPLEGRITAVADVFDALTTDRVYRKTSTLPEALSIMHEGRGSHFDPEILDLFLSSLSEILTIREHHLG